MPPTKPRVRPYKDFLTPALHRRFSRAAGAVLLLCYFEALSFSKWNSWIWPWFPLGFAGFRTSLFFICAFCIFILRVRNLHVGVRTTTSPFHTYLRHGFSWDFAWTMTVYTMSALLFHEIYASSAGLEVVVTKMWERPRLNEGVVYLRCFFITLAFVHANLHILADYDQIVTHNSASGGVASAPLDRFKRKLPMVLTRAIQASVIANILGPIFYTGAIRKIAWSWTLSFARLFYTLPQSGALPYHRPFTLGLFFKTFIGGVLLGLLWQTANVVFTEYVTQPPNKHGKPITSDSTDPNGSLLSGLKGKKQQTRAFAFWELACIAESSQDRRKAIFEDIDRAGGSAWSQVLEASLKTINSIEDHITGANKPSKGDLPKPGAGAKPLPRLTNPPAEVDIFTSSPKPAGTRAVLSQSVGSFAKEHGKGGQGWSGSPRALSSVVDAAIHKVKPDFQKAPSPDGIQATIRAKAEVILKSPAGWPFRLATRRFVALTVLGGPYGDYATVLNSIEAITKLALKSLEEDRYGNVQRDIPRILRTYTKTIETLEGFLRSVTPHWADVEEEIECPHVNAILAALRSGLNEICNAFGPYAEDLKLNSIDLRQAQSAAARTLPARAPTALPPAPAPASTSTGPAMVEVGSEGDRRAQRARDRELERQRERLRQRQTERAR